MTNSGHNVALLRKQCDNLDVPVAYTAQPGRMTDQQRGLLKDFWGPGMSAEPGERAVVPELAPAPSDWSLIKGAIARSTTLICWRVCVRRAATSSSCLACTHTSACWTTALEAFSHDIQPFLVADALGDFTEADHRHTLAYAALCCAMVVLTEDVLR